MYLFWKREKRKETRAKEREGLFFRFITRTPLCSFFVRAAPILRRAREREREREREASSKKPAAVVGEVLRKRKRRRRRRRRKRRTFWGKEGKEEEKYREGGIWQHERLKKKRETKISLSTISSSRERVTFDSRRAYEERERERERERETLVVVVSLVFG